LLVVGEARKVATTFYSAESSLSGEENGWLERYLGFAAARTESAEMYATGIASATILD